MNSHVCIMQQLSAQVQSSCSCTAYILSFHHPYTPNMELLWSMTNICIFFQLEETSRGLVRFRFNYLALLKYFKVHSIWLSLSLQCQYRSGFRKVWFVCYKVLYQIFISFGTHLWSSMFTILLEEKNCILTTSHWLCCSTHRLYVFLPVCWDPLDRGQISLFFTRVLFIY